MGHTFSNLLVHVVFSTKHRKPWLTEPVRERLFEYMVGVARQEVGIAYNVGGVSDHVHGLLLVKPSIAVSDAVGKWKALSSGWIKGMFAIDDFAWQAGFAAFSVSQSNRPAVANYMARQTEHHRKLSYQEELRALLDRHGMTWEPTWLDG